MASTIVTRTSLQQRDGGSTTVSNEPGEVPVIGLIGATDFCVWKTHAAFLSRGRRVEGPHRTPTQSPTSI